MSSKQSPWVRRFDGLLKREVVRARAEIPAELVSGLSSMPAHLALSALESGLNKVVVLTEVELDILLRFIECAHAYSVRAYPDLITYVKHLHSYDMDVLSSAPLCLTGLAGVGKSALLGALVRALPDDFMLELKSPLVDGQVMCRSTAKIRVDGSANFVDLLQPWLPIEYQEDSTVGQGVRRIAGNGHGLPDALRRATRFSYRTGLCTSLVDEMQFMSQSATANARVTQFLLAMTYLKVPLIYCANYSLCHKLFKRNQEDQDRLLRAPMVLSPLSLDALGLGKLLQAYDVVMGEVLNGQSLCEFMDEYASMTLGIKRKVQQLTLGGYAIMRAQGDETLTKNHFRDAYAKLMSASFVRDVNDLKQQSVEGRQVRGRPDLWCPFGDEFNRLDLAPEKDFRSAEAQVSKALMRDSLTRSERAILDGLNDSENRKTVSARSSLKKADVVQLSTARQGSITAADLLKNTMANRKK
jgi:hypothetical protein